MRLIAATIALALCLTAVAEEAPAPEIKFKLKGADQALVWLSGWSHAADQILSADAEAVEATPMCVPPGYELSSQELLEILNAKFDGATVTPEEASAALFKGLMERHRCEAGE
jgi:hypothetical protein